ncbi:Uncharacterized protein APZ42_030037 [Daphnia magna]|uniref:Uncharacterized protein n=1 Tax=Daphnia magna TaxID=35525 RepID=A0A164P405_9CRUS|nr:Uncharacterized protein APZ42_030037 [Daphnia magna]
MVWKLGSRKRRQLFGIQPSTHRKNERVMFYHSHHISFLFLFLVLQASCMCPKGMQLKFRSLDITLIVA